MNYLTIIVAVWTICAICAVLFIRGASLRDRQAAPTAMRERAPGQTVHTVQTVQAGRAHKDLSQTV